MLTKNERFLQNFEDSGLSIGEFAKLQNISYEACRSRIRRGKKNRENKKIKPTFTQTETKDTVEEKEINPNVLQVFANGVEIKTLGDLIKDRNIDLDVWQIKQKKHNSWTVTGKDGTTYTNYQVWATFIPKHPEPIIPFLEQIHLEIPKSNTKPVKSKTPYSTALYLADTQFGFYYNPLSDSFTTFHDREAIDIALQVAEIEHPDIILWAGDINDLPEHTDKFIKSPYFANTTNFALRETVWWLTQFENYCGKQYYFQGNHEKRFDDLMKKHAPMFYGLQAGDLDNIEPMFRLKNLLCLDKLGITHLDNYPTNEFWLNKSTKCVHGNLVRTSGNTATKLIDEACNVIFAHIHRRESVCHTYFGRDGITITKAMCPGCLCKIDGTVPGSRGQWQQGIALIRYNEEETYIEPIDIENGKAMYKGEVLVARDRNKEVSDILRIQV